MLVADVESLGLGRRAPLAPAGIQALREDLTPTTSTTSSPGASDGPARQQAGPKVTVEVEGRRMKLSSLEKVMSGDGDDQARSSTITPGWRPLSCHTSQTGRSPGSAIRTASTTCSSSRKNVPAGTPHWIRRAGSDPVFPFVDDLAALTFFANLNPLEFHVPQWRFEGEGRDAVPLNPDRLVIDLDPGPGTGLHEVSVVAVIARPPEEIGLASVQVTAARVCSSMAVARREHTSDEIRDTVQQRLHRWLTHQHRTSSCGRWPRTCGPARSSWTGVQNVAAKTTICPYSLRGREAPTVAAPRVAGDEAGAAGEQLRQLRMDEVLERVEQSGDLAAEIATPRSRRRGPPSSVRKVAPDQRGSHSAPSIGTRTAVNGPCRACLDLRRDPTTVGDLAAAAPSPFREPMPDRFASPRLRRRSRRATPTATATRVSVHDANASRSFFAFVTEVDLVRDLSSAKETVSSA